MTRIELRLLQTMEEMEQVQKIENAVWHMSPVPLHQTFTAMQNGGILLGAFDGQQMVGYLYSFAGFDGKHPYLCSHMHGILPEYRKQGLGVKMKQKQAEIAKRRGYQWITWTFDPLESLNAYVNLHKLKALAVQYTPNLYGTMEDQLNQGLPSDRMYIKWLLHEDRPKVTYSLEEERKLIHVESLTNFQVNQDGIKKVATLQKPWFVSVPRNFQKIKAENIELAKKWRKITRSVFQTLFKHGYYAYDLHQAPSKKVCDYVFVKSDLLKEGLHDD